MKKLENKKAIITGGNRGIGKAIALAYAKEGADIVIAYHTGEDEAAAVVAEVKQLGTAVKVKAVKMEITQENERAQLVDVAIELLGEINILVNCAGVCPRGAFLNASEQGYDHVMDVNFKGLYFLTQKVCEKMQKQGKGGSIINVSSSRDEGGAENISIYASSKAALTTFSRSIALELAHFGIRVNTIAPGLTQTDMHRETWELNPAQWQKRIEAIPLGRAGVANDIAALAVFLAADESGYVTGSRFLIDGGRSLRVG